MLRHEPLRLCPPAFAQEMAWSPHPAPYWNPTASQQGRIKGPQSHLLITHKSTLRGEVPLSRWSSGSKYRRLSTKGRSLQYTKIVCFFLFKQSYKVLHRTRWETNNIKNLRTDKEVKLYKVSECWQHKEIKVRDKANLKKTNKKNR